MNPSKKQISARSFYFGQFVADYFSAYKRYPTFQEMRIGFIYASRKAARHQ